MAVIHRRKDKQRLCKFSFFGAGGGGGGGGGGEEGALCEMWKQ